MFDVFISYFVQMMTVESFSLICFKTERFKLTTTAYIKCWHSVIIIKTQWVNDGIVHEKSHQIFRYFISVYLKFVLSTEFHKLLYIWIHDDDQNLVQFIIFNKLKWPLSARSNHWEMGIYFVLNKILTFSTLRRILERMLNFVSVFSRTVAMVVQVIQDIADSNFISLWKDVGVVR